MANGIDNEVMDNEVIDDDVEEKVDDFIESDDLVNFSKGNTYEYSQYLDNDDTIPGLPCRADFIGASIDASTNTSIDASIEDRDPLNFMPTDVSDEIIYDGGAQYVLKIYGTLEDGSKAEVMIPMKPFFHVRVPPGETERSFDARLNLALEIIETSKIRVTKETAFPAFGFNEVPVAFRRITSPTTAIRKKALEVLQESGFETASDDRSSYYRKAAREMGLPLSSWAVISDYIYKEGKQSGHKIHSFEVSPDNYKALEGEAPPDRTLVMAWDIETHSGRNTGDVPLACYKEDVVFMLCMSFHWKDETKPLAQICLTTVDSGGDSRWSTVLCSNECDLLKAFAICWRNFSPEIVAGFNDTGYDWPFVVEKARQHGVLSWMWLQMSGSNRKKITDEDVMKWNYALDKRIKIAADETITCSFLKVPGCVPIDVRVCLKKRFPKSEVTRASSLKFYLEMSGLESKADMPIKKMWEYYTAAKKLAPAFGNPNADTERNNMRKVAYYCVIDSVRCQELLVKYNIINDYREVSSLAYVSLFDSHFYAGGMKVCNLLGAYASRRNILVCMTRKANEETGKYPGAYVFAPKKGLSPNPIVVRQIDEVRANCELSGTIPNYAVFDKFKEEYPITGLDFSSLYPSIMMTYNLDPGKFVDDPDEVNRLLNNNYVLKKVSFPYNDRTVEGYFVQHGNDASKIGLFPSVLIDLFAKRAIVKKVLAVYADIIEFIESISSSSNRAESFRKAVHTLHDEIQRMQQAQKEGSYVIPPGSSLAEVTSENTRLLKVAENQLAIATKIAPVTATDDFIVNALTEAQKDANFKWMSANTKQNALKVYMNTFYGETGNQLSSWFLLPLAGGVTSLGQYNIKLVAEYVISRGFCIKYGDTDSLYLVCPEQSFVDCNNDYVNGRINKEEWFSAQVRISMRVMRTIQREVNEMLIKDNGSTYLKMAYEEVIFPGVFTGKKKYYGIPHVNEVNFKAKLFIRGIDVVKQGQSGLAKTIGYRIMMASVDINNTRTLHEIVEDTLRDAIVNSGQWERSHFVKSDAWRPHKNNVAVQRFIARMRSRLAIETASALSAASDASAASLYSIPEPGERFNYVIVKTDITHDLSGKKLVLKKGDRMEYATVAEALNYEVDIAYYLSNYIVGLCARFINGDSRYDQPVTDIDDADEKSQKLAKKALEHFILTTSGVDSTLMRKKGVALRKTYKKASAATKLEISKKMGASAAEVLQGSWLSYEMLTSDQEASEFVDKMWEVGVEYSKKLLDKTDITVKLGKIFGFDASGNDLGQTSARALYSCREIRLPGIDMLEARTRKELANAFQTISVVAEKYEAYLSMIVQMSVADENKSSSQLNSSDGLFTDEDSAEIKAFQQIWFKAVGIIMLKRRVKRFNDYKTTLKARRLNTAPGRDEVRRDLAIEAANMKPIENIDDLFALYC